MDIREVLSQSDSALPTLSTTTMTAAPAAGIGGFNPSNTTIVKTGASVLLGLLGMRFLAVGKREGDIQKMLMGAAISLVSMFIF